MPKKYRSKALDQKPQPTGPTSLRASQIANNFGESENNAVPSVNELIHQLRMSQSGHDRKLIHSQSQTPSNLPPTVRSILNLPETLPPRPREGGRNTGPSRHQRIPGPPPPRSWLINTSHASERISRPDLETGLGLRRIQYQHCNLPGLSFPSSASLQHLALKCFSKNWEYFIKSEVYDLSSLPVILKETLLSYIAIFNENRPINSLRVLFPTQDTSDSDVYYDDTSDVTRLDLSNVISSSISVRQISNSLLTNSRRTRSENPPAHIAPKAGVIIEHLGQIPDSWEEADEPASTILDDSILFIPSDPGNKVLRFSKLRHLSLAVAPGTEGHIASWSSLLSVITHLSTLSSLSLAHWPAPTYTPNAAKTRVKISNPISTSIPSIVYGGSDIYTNFDNDWKEAAGILRSLSRSLYCLKWLDLTGCTEWCRALIWSSAIHAQTNLPSFDSPSRNENSGPDWNGSWRGIEYLGLGVGWIPSTRSLDVNELRKFCQHIDDLHTFPLNWTFELLLKATRRNLFTSSGDDVAIQAPARSTHNHSWDVEEERVRYYNRKELERWLEGRAEAESVVRGLKNFREQARGRRIEFELGDRSFLE